MSKLPDSTPVKYRIPLYMNGLRGRMFYIPTSNQKMREILFVPDRYGSLEQWWNIILALHKFGSITATELPGFGGMQSFYKIHEYPSIDRLADYLAAFIKLRYKRKRLTIVAIGFGFVVATRMLQKYPDITKRVDLVLSIGGYAHKDDFRVEPIHRDVKLVMGKLVSLSVSGFIISLLVSRASTIRWVYRDVGLDRLQFEKLGKKNQSLALDFIIDNWQQNDTRTHFYTNYELMKLDNCKKHVDVELWNIALSDDRQFDNHLIEQHLRVTYRNVHQISVRHLSGRLLPLHEHVASKLLTTKIRQLFSR